MPNAAERRHRYDHDLPKSQSHVVAHRISRIRPTLARPQRFDAGPSPSDGDALSNQLSYGCILPAQAYAEFPHCEGRRPLAYVLSFWVLSRKAPKGRDAAGTRLSSGSKCSASASEPASIQKHGQQAWTNSDSRADLLRSSATVRRRFSASGDRRATKTLSPQYRKPHRCLRCPRTPQGRQAHDFLRAGGVHPVQAATDPPAGWRQP